MKFTAQEEYGLRCMTAMARHESRGAMTISELARAERLTPAYVGKLMRILRRGKLVESIHGPTGGYKLARPAKSVSVGEVLAVLGGRLYEPGICRRYPGDTPFCVHNSECAIRSLWAGLDLVVNQFLRRTSMADLVRSERTIAQWIRECLPAAVEAAAQAASGKS